MQMILVISSAIVAVGYDHTTNRMCIRFKGGREYDFCGVPESVHRAFLAAASKGVYFNDHIKDRYPC